jgi:hypothetical protein
VIDRLTLATIRVKGAHARGLGILVSLLDLVIRKQGGPLRLPAQLSERSTGEPSALLCGGGFVDSRMTFY